MAGLSACARNSVLVQSLTLAAADMFSGMSASTRADLISAEHEKNAFLCLTCRPLYMGQCTLIV